MAYERTYISFRNPVQMLLSYVANESIQYCRRVPVI